MTLNRPIIIPSLDGKMFTLYRKFKLKGTTVPKGFDTDTTSVPRILRSIIQKWGRYSIPAIGHDWNYFRQAMTRKEADRVFLRDMKDYRVCMFTRYLLYVSVRMFGMIAWKKHS